MEKTEECETHKLTTLVENKLRSITDVPARCWTIIPSLKGLFNRRPYMVTIFKNKFFLTDLETIEARKKF